MLGDALARQACLILAGLLLAALAGLAGVWMHGRAELAEARQAHAQYVAGVERHAREASEAARAEEQRRKDALDETIRIAKRAAARDADDRARRAAAAARVRDRADYLAGRCSGAGDPGPAGGGETAAEAGALLADMLRRLEAAAGELASAADAAVTAGRACEGAYDSLSQR